jgi:hypothetical protein
MSKLSVHISSGNRSGFTDWLDTCQQGGNPIGIIYSVDENISGDLAQHSPTTKWVYRYQTDEFNRLPDGFLEGDPVANCTTWMTKTKDSHKRTLMDNWRLNKADWFDPLNEPVADIPAKAQWLNTWMVTALEIADQNGFNLALFSFTTGFSIDSAIWTNLLPALRRGKELGSILSLHAYWENADPSQDIYNALRYRELYKIIPADAQLPIVISEASPGNGYDTGKKGQTWIDNMALYDTELMKDPYVLGACGFQLGGQESNLRSALPQYAIYIAKTPPTTSTTTPPADSATTTTTLTDSTTAHPTISNEPLDFDVNVASCKKDHDRPNGIIVTFQFNVVGGSTPYTYSHEGQTLSGPTFDRLATRSGPIIDNFAVTSSDGQTRQKKLFFSPKDMECA